MKKIKEQKDKGFTLVELIVVIVILAILAAILVPALLGYIDKAKKQQIVLNAKSCLTAAQADLSSMYAAGKDPTVDGIAQSTKDDIINTADVADCTTLLIGVEVETDNEHSKYTVKFVEYAEGGEHIYYNGSSWDTEVPDDTILNKVSAYTIKGTGTSKISSSKFNSLDNNATTTPTSTTTD
jgi:prepilin-type N-terminal cleavage/methylation domain-containing protein